MTASAPGLTEPQTVGLSFHHELARVNVIIVSEGDAVNISNAKLYGISHTGSLNENTWALGTVSNSSQPSFTTITLAIADTQEHLLFGGDLLLPPHAGLDAATLEFDYQYTTGDTEVKHSKLSLKTTNVTAWEKGQYIKYKITIPLNNTDIKFSVEILPWDEKDYNVTW